MELTLEGEVRRKLSFMYVLGFVVLRDVVKVFPVSSSFGVCEKDDHGTGNQACDKVTGSGALVTWAS